jgi:hypothetical protein
VWWCESLTAVPNGVPSLTARSAAATSRLVPAVVLEGCTRSYAGGCGVARGGAAVRARLSARVFCVAQDEGDDLCSLCGKGKKAGEDFREVRNIHVNYARLLELSSERHFLSEWNSRKQYYANVPVRAAAVCRVCVAPAVLCNHQSCVWRGLRALPGLVRACALHCPRNAVAVPTVGPSRSTVFATPCSCAQPAWCRVTASRSTAIVFLWRPVVVPLPRVVTLVLVPGNTRVTLQGIKLEKHFKCFTHEQLDNAFRHCDSGKRCHKHCLHAFNFCVKVKFDVFQAATGYSGPKPDVRRAA